jgi:hypothetical protein
MLSAWWQKAWKLVCLKARKQYGMKAWGLGSLKALLMKCSEDKKVD